MDAVIGEAEQAQQWKARKIKLLQQVSELPENKVEEVHAYLMNIFMGQDAHGAGNEEVRQPELNH